MSPFPAGACAIVLAGGAGTRIRHLHPDVPKPLIPVAGRPFLDWICAFWIRQGVRRMVISLGHLAEVAERHLSTRNWPGVEMRTVREAEPLGTGGAIRLAAASVADADPLIVLNGDSLAIGDASGLWPPFDDAATDGAILGVNVDDVARYGTLRIGADGMLAGFDEKRPGRGSINAGIYVFRRRVLSLFPAHSPLSMEHEVFPALLAAGARLRAVVIDADFIDIGAPEALGQAESFIARHAEEFAP